MSYFDDEENKLSKLYPGWIDMTIEGDAADQFAELHHSTEGIQLDAIRRFSVDEIWPPMSRQAGAMVRMRVLAAYDYVDGLQFAHRNFFFQLPENDWSRARWIAWFLIDVWDGVGFPKIHGMLETLRRADDADSPLRYLHN